jgi:hypothetical protein
MELMPPTAAYEVGSESVSQFNREYSRLFGQPPMRDIKALRDSKGTAIDVAQRRFISLVGEPIARSLNQWSPKRPRC